MSNLPPVPPPPPAGPPTPPPPPQPAGSVPPANPGAYASWGKRVLSCIIDYIPAAILGGIGYGILFASSAGTLECDQVTGVCTSTGTGASGVGLFFGIVLLIASVVYWLWNRVWKMGVTGASIGMGVVGTKAVKETTGEPLGFGLNLLRQILLAVDFWICYIGALWPLWDSKRQCLISDKATGAVVLPTK